MLVTDTTTSNGASTPKATNQDNGGLSIDEILDLRSEAVDEFNALTRRRKLVGEAIEQVDAALQAFTTDRSIDAMQSLWAAARDLAPLANYQPDSIPGDNRDFCADARIARGMMTAPELPSTMAELMGAA